MIRAFGAALAAVLFATPASATVYDVTKAVGYTGTGLLGDGGVNFFTDPVYFPDITLLPGDTLNFTAVFDTPIPGVRIPENSGSMFYLGEEPSCGYNCKFRYDNEASYLSNPITNSWAVNSDNINVSFTLSPFEITGFTTSVNFFGPQGASLDVIGVQSILGAIPEPSTWAMLVIGLAALGWKNANALGSKTRSRAACVRPDLA